MDWGRLELAELKEIVVCLGGPALSHIFRLFAEDYSGWAAGLPDLLLWNPTRGTFFFKSKHHSSGAALLVEVKGPRDRLSDKQRAWIEQLLTAGLRIEVCHVQQENE